MMAAGSAGASGAKVILLEKNPTLGKKLLITGGGRCNITNATPNEKDELEVRHFLKKYKHNDKFLFSAFSQLDVKNTLEFFWQKNMKTKVEKEGRVFPLTEKSESVLKVLTEYMKEGKVEIKTKAEVSGFVTNENKEILEVKLKGGKKIKAKKFILATGGTSRPETGSTGDAIPWLHTLGHTVVKPDPSLVPVALKDEWIKKLQGATFQDIRLTLFQNGQKQESSAGKKNGKLQRLRLEAIH